MSLAWPRATPGQDRDSVKLVIFPHPDFQLSESMPRFARMLQSGFAARGHTVELWSPKAQVFNWVPRGRWSKWAGYVDQYILFPFSVRKALKRAAPDTLFVFCDQALGPWVPLVKDRPHVVHVHDLLALRSALGDIPENPTALSGRIYQRYIRRGYRMARHFISISRKTRDDLLHFGGVSALTSEVVYNGLNYPYEPLPGAEAERVLRAAGLPVEPDGMLLHVGGNQWYKNQVGLILLYASYAAQCANPLPLWCISPEPDAKLRRALAEVPAQGKVLFFQKVDNPTLQAAYSHARAFLFPSLAEGFGWPLIESQACGCPVITTDEAPMNEVAGEDARYLPRLKVGADVVAWASHGASVLRELLDRSASEKAHSAERRRSWVKRFSADAAIDAYLAIYQRVLAGYGIGARQP
jgi:glycosyltransferase involved in cell wall biosynthesis